MPRLAMIKANSPTCASEKPQRIAVFTGWPEMMKPRHEKATLPITTISVIRKIGQAYVTNIDGSTIMPTETKNTAPKKSLIG